MKFTKIALTLICSMLMFCACTKNSDVVIKVNDEAITRGEFYSDFDRIKNVQFKHSPKEFQKDDSYPVIILKDRFVNDVIVRKLLSQEFEKRKIEATSDEITARKNATIEQIGSKEQLDRILKENNISEKKFDEDMAAEVKIEKLIEQLGTVKISPKDAENYYKKNKEQFRTNERAQVSHILIRTTPESIKRIITDSDKEGKLSAVQIDEQVQTEVKRKKALAQEVKTKAARNPKDFAKLANEYSEDEESAKRGGDIGYVQKGQMNPELEYAVFKQKIGEVGIAQTGEGTHIFIVKDKAPAGVQSFNNVKEDLIRFLTMQKKGELLGKLIDGLRANAKIEFVDPSLNPENIKKQADEALKKQIEREQKINKNAPDEQGKQLDKLAPENK